ncbi:hypothetical protein HOD38_05920 [archaeon]|nr:hypothetical protein [archaeon]MBT4397775.1 hypothetical protein [archaeon]MBT4441109.1 hypothetical protein [archaeon]
MAEPEKYEYKNDLERELGADIRLLFTRRASLLSKLDAARGGFHEAANDFGVIEGADKATAYLDTLTTQSMAYLGDVFKETPFASVFNTELTELITQYLKDPSKVDKTKLTAVTETVEWMKNIAGIDFERLYADAQKNGELNVLELQQTIGQAQEASEGYNMRSGAIALQKRATTPETLKTLEDQLREFHPGMKPVVGPQDLGSEYFGRVSKYRSDFDGAKQYLQG